MLTGTSHRKNKILIKVMLMIFAVGLLLFLTACNASKIDKSRTKTEKVSKIETIQAAEKQTRHFDFTTILEQDYEIKYLPIDPLKEMEVGTSETTGQAIYKNAIPVFTHKTTATQKDITEEINEAKTTNTTTQEKATTDETTKHKYKISAPWYAFLILGFFGFATMIGLFLISRVLNNVKKLNV